MKADEAGTANDRRVREPTIGLVYVHVKLIESLAPCEKR
jgi:hypothetical protein